MVQLGEYFITPDGDYPTFGYHPGLGLVEGFGIEVHYRKLDSQMKGIQDCLESRKIPVYAISDEGAIIVNRDKIIMVGDVIRFEPNHQ